MVYLLTEDVLKNSKNGETGPSNHSTDNTTGRSAIFGSSVLSKGLWHMSNVYIPPSLSSSSLSTLLCSAPCLLSACLGDSLVTGSDGRGAGVSSSPQPGLTALRSVSCVVPPVSSCPLTVRDWERRAGSQSASPSQHSRGQRPPVIPTPAQACRDTKYNHYTLQCTVREWGWSSPRMGPPSGILEAVSDNTLVCRVWPERPQRLHHERVSRGWAGDRCQLPRCK